MKKKKLVKGLAALVLVLVVTACGSDVKKESAQNSSTTATTTSSVASEKLAGGELKNGTYKLEEKNEINGYRTVFEMVVKDGKITSSKFDSINANGKSKAKDDEYQKNMKDKTGVGPVEFIPKLNDALVIAQNAEDVDAVTGATRASGAFKNYAQQLIQAAQAGNSKTIEIDNGADLQDGTYTLKEKNDSNGYHTEFTIVVKDGKVAESKYDNVNDAGKSKTEDQEYNKNMKDQAGVYPKTYISKLNEELVVAMKEKDGIVSDVDVVTGATHSSQLFLLYAEQLINAAEKGDTTEIIVDNIVMAN